MTFIEIFTKPHAKWWPKPYHAGPRSLLFIAITCILYWLLVIASSIYSAVFEKNNNLDCFHALIGWQWKEKEADECDSRYGSQVLAKQNTNPISSTIIVVL